MQHNGLDRRTFLKGAGITAIGAAAMGALTGCGNGYTVPAGEEPVNASAGQVPGTPSWLGQAPEVAERDITETIDTEVLVVGMPHRRPARPSSPPPRTVRRCSASTARALHRSRSARGYRRHRLDACSWPRSTSTRSSGSTRWRQSRTSSAMPTASSTTTW